MQMIDSAYIASFFRIAGEKLEEQREDLCALDGAIGDGDHGTSMANGFAAINARIRELSVETHAPAYFLEQAASAFLNEVGATVGPLYASAFLGAAQRISSVELAPTQLGELLEGFADGVRSRGNAELGDKTMLDAWIPALQAARDAEQSGGDALAVAQAAARAANEGANATTSMIAMRGRAARLKERSLGHLDPGAVSAALLIAAFADLAGAGK